MGVTKFYLRVLILCSLLDVLGRKKVMECDREGSADSSSSSSGGGSERGHHNQDHYRYNRGQHDGNTEGSGESSPSSSKWRFGTRGGSNGDGDTGGGSGWLDDEDWLAMSAAALRSAVDRGMVALKKTFAKIKAAAEDTAYAAARPRHW